MRIISLTQSESNPTEPLTLSEVKDHLKIDFNDSDTYLTALSIRCRKELEKYLGLSLVVKTITLIIDADGEFQLPYGPVSSITSVHRVGGSDDGLPTYDTLSADEYTLTGNRLYAGSGRLKIVYSTGATPSDDIKQQLLMLIANRNEHAGDEKIAPVEDIIGYVNRDMSWL